MKKKFSVLASLAIVLAVVAVCLFTLPREAKAATEGDYTYSVSNGKATITDYNGAGGDITIPSTLGGYPVTTIGNYAFASCASLTSVTIGDSVTTIGDSVTTIGDSVTTIGSFAFAYCDSLTTVTIGDGVTSVGYRAFYDCDSLTSVTIPDSVTTIGECAFYDCDSLTTVTIGDSVTTIGDSAFSFCDSLTSVTIPDSVTTIGNFAFENCNSLNYNTYDNGKYLGNSNNPYVAFIEPTSRDITSCQIASATKVIGGGAFYDCARLTSVTISDSVESIGNSAFAWCWRLNNVYYAGAKSAWDQIEIANGNKDLTDATFFYNHIHNYTLITPVTVKPTCTEMGYTEYTCVYGDKYREYTAALGHNYVGKKITQKPTCEENGYTGVKCTRCSDIRKDTTTGALGHSPVAVSAKDATCTADGYTLHTKCDRCKTNLVEPTIYPAKGHSYDAGKVTKAATCKAAGVRTYTCKVCKATKTAAIAKLTKHTYSNNCDTACNVCKAKRTIKHAYKTTTTKATLSKNGKTVKKCTVCGKVASTTVIRRVKTVKLSATSYVYNGKAKTPSVTVKDSAGKTLKKGTDYTVSYAKGRKNVGTYKVTIKMKGKYTGTKTLTFKIVPKAASINKLTAKSKAIAVKLNRVTTQSTGYQIQYSTSSKFTSAKTVNVTSYKTSSKTISGLKKGKKYYVRVRTYKTVGKTKFYSAWSSAKSVKVK